MSHPPGPRNSITDVPGVRVGHLTRITSAVNGGRPIRTGITAIFATPLEGRVARPAAVMTVGGRTEITGLNFIDDFGFLTNPIIATSMRSLGRVYDAVLSRRTRRASLGWPPVVVGFDDGRLCDQRQAAFTEDDVSRALDDANEDQASEGAVGAGAGLVAFGYKSGVGSASRRVTTGGTEYIVGALALLNLGRREDLRPEAAVRAPAPASHPPPLCGSALVAIVTSAPLDDRQCRRAASAAMLGLGRVGSVPGAREGVVCCAVSTGVQLTRGDRSSREIEALRASDLLLGSVADAAIDAAAEAALRSLTSVKAADGTAEYPAMSAGRTVR